MRKGQGPLRELRPALGAARGDPLHAREQQVDVPLRVEGAGARAHRARLQRCLLYTSHLAPRIQGWTLMGTGLLDNICPPSTQFAAYNHMSCEKEHLVFPDYKHEVPREWDEAALLWLLRM